MILYGLEVCALNKSQTSLYFVINGFFVNMFKPTDIVKACHKYFPFDLP